jgi:hypothetical protein
MFSSLITRALVIAALLLPGSVRAAPKRTGLELTPINLPPPGFRTAALTAGVSWTQIGEDHFVAMKLGTVLDFGAFRMGIWAPLNLRTVDGDPQNDGVVRREDWDERSEWFRILRFVEVGHPRKGPLYARYGELVANTMGHGTIVDAYYNSIDLDHYQGGLAFRLDLGPFGGEILADNLADPSLLGTRLFARPFRVATGATGLLGRLTTGISIVSDLFAPTRAILDDNKVQEISGNGTPQATREGTTILGFDVELPLLDSDELVVMPYLDLNSHVGVGGGTHLGVLNLWEPSPSFRLSIRVEARLLGAGYLPGYVSPLYEVERFRYRNAVPKLAHARSEEADSFNGGGMAELGATIFDSLVIKGRYEGSGRPSDDGLWLQAAVPYLGPFRMQATYLKRNADSFESLFDLDGAMLVAEARYKVYGPLVAQALFSREWRVKRDGLDRGSYDTIDTWEVGVLGEFEF